MAAVLIAIIGSVLLVRSGRLATLEARERLVALEHSVQSAQILFLDALDDRSDQQPVLEKTLTQALGYFDKPSDGQYLSRLAPEELRRARAARAEAMFLQAAEFSRQAELRTEEAERKVLWTQALDSNRRASELLDMDARPVTALASQAALLSERLELSERLDDRTSALQPADRVPASAHQFGWSAALLTAQRRYREARPQWESATRAEPRNMWTWYGLGHCYERLGQHGLAAECFSACIALAPEQTQWYFRRGLAHLHQNLPALAREDFTTVIERDPQHTDARVNRALASLALDAPAQAIEDLSQAIAQGNHSARVFLMRSQAREQAGDNSGAQADRQAGFSRPADDEQGWTAQGVLRAQSDPRAALQDFDAALRINPSFLPALESKAHVLAEQLDDTDAAIRVLDEAISRHPEESVILAAKGVLLARQGRIGAAKALAEKALAIDSSASILYQTATLYALVSREEKEASERAFALLTAALRAGFGAELLADDRDLDPLRNDRRFERLSSAMQTLTAASDEASGNNESAGGH
ncbi:MAG: tetratricopeptide repeat protein [Aureliella sp.]